MDARLIPAALAAAALLSLGAGARSQNFVVQAATPQLAKEICQAAETYRRDLAVEWLGRELPPWQQPCPINAQVQPGLGAGGATSFMFDQRSRPFGWQMDIQGSRERVLDSVLPHEVTHTIFATHFGRPLPRWADEGACTTVEHESEKLKQEKFLIDFLMTNRGIAFNKMFAMKEYPTDILPLYSQGYSLVRYLIQQGGKPKYVAFLGHGMKTNHWSAAINEYYGFKDLSELQVTWVEWVRAGSPDIDPAKLIAVAPAASAIPTADVNTGTPAVAALGVTNPAVVGSNSAAIGYERPMPPNSVAKQSVPPAPTANSAARPNADSFYAKPRPQPAAKPAVLIPATYPWPASGGVQAARKQVSLPTSTQGRQVLMEWSRPADQPWAPGAIAQAAAQEWQDSSVDASLAAGAYYAQPSVSARPTTVPEGAGTIWR